jgi:hypothetical protein
VPIIKKIKMGFGLLIVAFIALFLFYNLPRTAVVQISGTDIKRVDRGSGEVVKKVSPEGQSTIETYDVRFINALSRSGKTMVFRNEDTGWGWPPYFKFNSADLTAQAQAYASAADKPWVLVTYYGWRIHILSMFPNAVSLQTVDKNYSHFPLFNVIVVSLLAIAIFIVVRKVKKWFAGRHRPEKS